MDIVRNVDLKNANKLKVLNLIKDKSPISRADIAVELNLSRSTVSQIIEELLDKGWIEELGYGESTERGGKRPILLQIKKQAVYVIAVFFSSTYSNIAITDLSGEILVSKKIRYTQVLDYQTHFSEILDIINELISEVKKESSAIPIIGCGVVVRGLVDVDKKILLYSAILNGWNNVPIGEYFKTRLNVPIFIENDIRSITSYEYYEFKSEKPKVLMCINSENGIALGVAIDGNVFYGSQYGVNATHAILDVNGPKCSCGNKGCWDTIASIDTMIAEVKKRKKLTQEISYEDILKMYDIKDPDVLEVLIHYTGYWMSVGVVNALNNYNPDKLILLGEIFETFKEVRDCVVSAISAMPNKIAKNVQVIIDGRKKNLLLSSSANLVISKFYSNEHHEDIVNHYKFY